MQLGENPLHIDFEGFVGSWALGYSYRAIRELFDDVVLLRQSGKSYGLINLVRLFLRYTEGYNDAAEAASAVRIFLRHLHHLLQCPGLPAAPLHHSAVRPYLSGHPGRGGHTDT